MKVDLVVNSMIQQIDRNLLSQSMPAALFRAGEILRGRVMLDAGDRPQIRLDSGELLNAMPSGGIQLFAGATVTLRVTGNVDGQLVMQLLEQEIDGKAAAAESRQAPWEELLRLEFGGGKAVLEAMASMRVPLREETARQALTILNANPRLGAEKAVFLAANGIEPTDGAITALNALVAGAETGAELIKLADMIAQAEAFAPPPAAQAAKQTAPQPAEQSTGQETPQPQTISQSIGQPAAQPAAQEVPQSAGQPTPQPAAQAVPQSAGQPTPQPAAQEVPQSAGQLAPQPAAQAVSQSAAQLHELPGAAPGPGVAAASSREYTTLELQSLVSVALGPEAVERYSHVISALQRRDYIGRAVGLALDGSLGGGLDFEAALTAFAASLPADTADEARAFVTALAGGLKNHAETLRKAPGDAVQGVQRVVRELMDLFVKLDDGAAAGANELRQSREAVRGTVQRAAAELRSAGGAGPDASMQLNRVESHVRLIDTISQYAYRQIPMELNGRNRTVELYVMNRGGGSKRINPEKASILIALDTENMGRLETLIAVNGKSLRLRFGVENPALMGYVNSFTGDLDRAMKEIGFRLSDVRAQVAARPVTPLTAAAEAETFQESTAGLDIKL